METVELAAQVRSEFGKGAVGRLRKQGLIPAVVYKHGEQPTAVKLLKKDFLKTLHTKAGENVLITLKVNLEITKEKEKDKGKDKSKGKEKSKQKEVDKTVLIKDIQENPVTDEVIHIDFNEISLTELITVKVPLVDKGEAVGVKRDEGILEHMLWEVEVECLPTQIPEKLEVDVSNLQIGQDIFVKDIPIPEGVKILADPGAIVCSVKTPKEEVIPTPEEAAAEMEEPEVIRERKPEAEEEAAAEAPEEKPKEKKEKE